MVDPIKELLQVQLNDPLLAFLQILLGLQYSLMGIATIPKSVAVGREFWLIPRA
jgi:hypothetical protein